MESAATGDRLYKSESDVCRRQILTYEVLKIFILEVGNIGIKINQKELTKICMMISN